MRWHKLIRIQRDGVDLAADINAALAVSQGDQGANTKVESVSHARVVQDSRPRETESAGTEAAKPNARRQASRQKEQPNE